MSRARAVFFPDSNEAHLARAGDVVIPMATGVITMSHIRAEIGAVLTGDAPGRKSEDEITVFKSLGVAVQDMVLGALSPGSCRGDRHRRRIRPSERRNQSGGSSAARRQTVPPAARPACLPRRPRAPAAR